MKYVTVPEPVKVEFLQDKEGNPLLYSFANFLSEWVWVSEKWRNTSDPEYLQCALRLMTLFENAKPGDVVELQNKDHEKLVEVAAMQDQKLQPQFALIVMKMLLPISTAKDSQ